MAGYDVLRFQTHHIFPRELFSLGRTAQLEAFGIVLDMNGNKVALVEDPQIAASFRNADQNVRNALHDAGWGFARHDGFHNAYNQFLIAQVSDILSGNLSPEAQRLALFDLHRFATDVSNGRASLTSGVDVYSSQADLEAAWAARPTIDYANPTPEQASALETYIGRIAKSMLWAQGVDPLVLDLDGDGIETIAFDAVDTRCRDASGLASWLSALGSAANEDGAGAVVGRRAA